MLRKILTVSVLTVFMGIAPALAQEQPAETPAPEAEQPPPAKADTAKKSTPAPRHRRVTYRRYEWPWTWAWYRLQYDLHHIGHR